MVTEHLKCAQGARELNFTFYSVLIQIDLKWIALKLRKQNKNNEDCFICRKETDKVYANIFNFENK